MVVVMHLLTRRLFAVDFEWRRLGQLLVVIGGLAVGGELLLPTHGLLGAASRALVFLAIPGVLLATGFVHRDELRAAHRLWGGLRRSSPEGVA